MNKIVEFIKSKKFDIFIGLCLCVVTCIAVVVIRENHQNDKENQEWLAALKTHHDCDVTLNDQSLMENLDANRKIKLIQTCYDNEKKYNNMTVDAVINGNPK